MASGLIGIQVPRKGLWVRVPCPPLQFLVALAREPTTLSIFIVAAAGVRRVGRQKRMLSVKNSIARNASFSSVGSRLR
jgi:hypothetical protein